MCSLDKIVVMVCSANECGEPLFESERELLQERVHTESHHVFMFSSEVMCFYFFTYLLLCCE